METTVYGLEMTDLEPFIEDFGWTHTAFYESMEQVREASRHYLGLPYRLALVVEVLDGDGWHTVSREVIQEAD